MRPTYMGGVRGYQSAVHRPGMGPGGSMNRRRLVHEPAVFKKSRAATLDSHEEVRRRGFRTKAAFIASFATVAAVVAIAFVGSAQF